MEFIDFSDRFWSNVNISDNDVCWEWGLSRRKNGYGQVSYGSRNATTHRVAYELSIGEIPKGMVVMHSCDNRACCNPNHLSVGTQRDNIIDMISKGRGSGQAYNGCESRNKKIDKSEYPNIKYLLDAGVTGRDIARRYNVDESTISYIKRNKL